MGKAEVIVDLLSFALLRDVFQVSVKPGLAIGLQRLVLAYIHLAEDDIGMSFELSLEVSLTFLFSLEKHS